MKNFFPPKNQNYTYLQTNRSDDLGSLWSTMNLDFQSNLGTMRIAPRLMVNTATATQANLQQVAALTFFDNRYFAICGERIFRNGGYSPRTSFAEDTSTGVQTDYDYEDSDLMVFNGSLWAVGNSDLYYKDANGSGTGDWHQMSTSPSSGTCLLVISRKFNRLYVTNGTSVDSTDGTTYAATGDYTISLSGDGTTNITAVCETSNSIWLGTTNTENESGYGSIFQWDGISPQASQRFYLKAPGAYAMVVKDDVPYVMDCFGVFSKFTGSSFEEIGRLPFSYFLSDDSTGFTVNNERFIHPKGIALTKNGTFLFNVYNTYDNSTSSIPENGPSGVYEFAENIGFTHKYSFTYNVMSSSTITDFGQNQVGTISADPWVGPIINAWTPDNTSTRNGLVMCGARYYTDATTQTDAIFIDDSNNTKIKKGYFVTTWFNSQEIEDKWSRIWAIYKRLLNSNDTIVLKYRLYEENPIVVDITWTSNSTFRTTTDISAYGPTATGFNGTIGGEVEGIQGTGSGACRHITSIIHNGGNYDVELDGIIDGTTGTAKVRLQKWIKLLPEISGQVKSWEQLAIGANNTRIQIKCCMTFTDDGENWNEFTKLILTSNEDIKATL